MNLIFAILLVVFIFSFLIAFAKQKRKGNIAVLAILVNSILSSWIAIQTLQGRPFEEKFYGGIVFGEVIIHADALSGWFILMANFTMITGILYGKQYMKVYENRSTAITLHYISYVLNHFAMISIFCIQHALAFLCVWEVITLTALLLVMFEYSKPETLKAGVNYLVQMHIGVTLLAIGFIWVYLSEGSFDFSALGNFFKSHNPVWLFLIFFIGFGIKAGFIPLHTWLPHAHPAAPSHISGVMSGVIVKLGIYGIFRMITYLHSNFLQIGEGILILSVLTAFYGILNAAVHRDIKRMLAFCTIENIGIIGIGIGIGLIGKATGNSFIFFIGFAAALLHTLNHSLYKSLLFFTTGNIYQQTHTRNMEQLGGLIKKMPKTALFFLCGSLAITALPPFNGFISEFLIYSGLIEGIKAGNIQFNLLMILGIAVLAIVGGVSMFTFTKSFGTVFLGSPRKQFEHDPTEVSKLMQAPLFIILALMLFIGIFPNIVLAAVVPVINVFGLTSGSSTLLNIMSPTLVITGRISLCLFLLAGLIYFIRTRLSVKKAKANLQTWACGYAAPDARMQYTGKSFTKSLAKLFSFFTAEKKKYREIDVAEVFPTARGYQSHYSEFFEARIIDKVNNRVIGFLNYFTFIQSGQTQRYILYGLLFIIALFAATFFNLI